MGITRAATKNVLKNQFKKPKNAKPALVELVTKSEGSVDKCYEHLREMLRPNATIPIRSALDTTRSDEVRQVMAEGSVCTRSYGQLSRKLHSWMLVAALTVKSGAPWMMMTTAARTSANVAKCTTPTTRADATTGKCLVSTEQKSTNAPYAAKLTAAGRSVLVMRRTACQVSDWKEHKKVCAWNLGKKKETNS